jgi:hypothetical protein
MNSDSSQILWREGFQTKEFHGGDGVLPHIISYSYLHIKPWTKGKFLSRINLPVHDEVNRDNWKPFSFTVDTNAKVLFWWGIVWSIECPQEHLEHGSITYNVISSTWNQSGEYREVSIEN